ncbi:MAG: HAMP domain-containing sensor histidine kinase [Planctomycetia bacterium]|nr:HAMP domain-containing sensor histidine kinase [Planctomycetia bacterium]
MTENATPDITWPIRYQLLLPNLGVLGFAIVGAALLGAVWSGRVADRRIEHQLHSMAATLANSRFPLTDAVLAQVRDLSGTQLAVTNQAGKVVTLSDPALAAFPFQELSPLRSGNTERVKVISDRQGEQYLHCTVALNSRSANTRGETLHVLFPHALWWDAVATAVWPPLLVGLVGAGIGVPTGLRLAWRIAERIERLRQHLAQLAAGRTERLIVDGPHDELRSLAVAANQLADQLDGFRQTIQRQERLAVVGQWNAGLLHQLRNCAAGAQMAVRIHRKHCIYGDVESLDVAARQLDLLSDHVQRSLVMGREERPARGSCQVGEARQEIMRLLSPMLRHRRVTLEWNGDADATIVPVSSENLRHLISNLLINAVDAAGAGGKVTVASTRSEDLRTCIHVRDSGPGLATEVVASAFEAFVTTKAEGIGLGLAICRRIMEDCGGSLSYRHGDGACFEAQFPAITADTLKTTETVSAGDTT